MGKNYDYLCTYIDHDFGPAYRLVMAALYSAATGVTTVLNSLILISIWKTPSLHKPSYILIASLALSDLLVGAIGDPLLIIINITALKKWSVETFCLLDKSAKAIVYAFGAISLSTLTFISLDRLLAVKLMKRYQSVVTQKRVLLFLVIGWIVPCIVSGALFGALTWDYDTLSALMLLIGITAFALVLCITVCYSMAFYSLRKITSSSVSPSVQNAEAVARPSSNIDVAKYRKSLVTMFVVFISTILFCTPFVCMVITASVFRYKLFSSQMYKKNYDTVAICASTAEFILLLNSAVNPLLYLWRIRDIRETVKTTVKSTLTIF